MTEIKQNRHRSGKTLAIGLSKYSKVKALSSFSFTGKIRLLFCLIWASVTGHRVRIKIWHILFHPLGSWAFSSKKDLVPALSSFAAIACKGHFRKNSNKIFKFGCISRYRTHIFDKNEFKLLNQLAPISNSKIKTEKVRMYDRMSVFHCIHKLWPKTKLNKTKNWK